MTPSSGHFSIELKALFSADLSLALFQAFFLTNLYFFSVDPKCFMAYFQSLYWVYFRQTLDLNFASIMPFPTSYLNLTINVILRDGFMTDFSPTTRSVAKCEILLTSETSELHNIIGYKFINSVSITRIRVPFGPLVISYTLKP